MIFFLLHREKFADFNEIIIGFDLEWPVTSSGSGRTALIQICPDESVCYLFHVSIVKVVWYLL